MITAKPSGIIKIGKMNITRLGFGAMRVTGPNIWGSPQNLSEAKNLLRRVIELGVNFIDTADSYGPEISENIISESLRPYPEDLVIATKGGLLRPSPQEWIPCGLPDYLRQCVEMSLRRLRLERIELYQLHAIDTDVPLEESLEALAYMQKQGKIHHIGLSNVTVSDIERAKKITEIVTVQNLYNINNRRSQDVLEYCEKNGIGFIPWYPLGSGELTRPGTKLDKLAKKKGATPSQIALAWLLKRSPVMLPIPGTSSIKHLEENVGATTIELNDEEFADLRT